MDIQWKDVESTVQPTETDSQISTNGVYIRKDITQQSRSNNGITIDFWLYKEAFLSKEEYLQYMDEFYLTDEFKEKQKNAQILKLSENWAQEEKKYMQLISKTTCCGQTAAQNTYKIKYQQKKQAFLNLVIAIRKGEA